MQKVRIKKAPQLGEQVDYSFYDSRYRNMGMGGSSESDVKNTMGPVPREEANIEVELGEVVVGDTNQDGFLELFAFTGKPHSKGGTPVNVPPGSFIFSNTKKLFIKDESLLKELFGLSPRKGGYSPAEIAKKYQINEYVDKLKDKDSDNLTKRTAQTVLDKHLEKLGELALIQESMKGFPDGIPAIALAAAEKMGLTPDSLKDMQSQGQPQQEQQMPQQGMMPPQGPQEEMMEPQQEPMTQEMMEGMMRRGGRVLKRYQDAGTQTEEEKQKQKMIGINAGLDELPSLEAWAKLHQRVGPYNNEVFGFYETPGTLENQVTGYKVPAVGSRFFINDTSPLIVENVQPEKIISNWNPFHPMNRDIITLKDELTGKKYEMSEAEFMMLMGTGSNRYKNNAIKDDYERAKYERDINSKIGSKFFKINPEITTLPQVNRRDIQDEWGNKTGLVLSSGDKISYAGKNYSVITPYGENKEPYAGIGWTGDSWKRLKDTFDNTQGIILVKDENGEYDYLEGEDVAAAYKSGMPSLWQHLPGAYLAELAAPGVYTPIDIENNPEASPMESAMKGKDFYTGQLVDSLLQANPDTTFAYDTKKDQTIITTSPPVEIEEKAKKGKKIKSDTSLKTYTADDFEMKKMGGEHYSLPHYMTTFEMGGNLPFYQDAGPVKESDLIEKQVPTADGSMVWTWQTSDGTIISSSISRAKAQIKKDNFINAQRIAANDAEMAAKNNANNASAVNSSISTQVPSNAAATNNSTVIGNTTTGQLNNIETKEPETYGPSIKPRGFSRTEPKLASYTLPTLSKQEELIGETKGGEPMYKQPNGDVYIKDKATGRVKAIKYSNGDIGNITSEGIIERRPILKDKNGKEVRDKNGRLQYGDATAFDVVDPNQKWKEKDWKGEYMDDVKVFESLINDPKNQNLRDAMYEEYKKIAAASPNSKELLALSKEDAIATMIEGNRQMSTIQSAYKDQPEFLKADRWDRDVANRVAGEKDVKGSGLNRLYNATARRLGFDPMTDVQGTAYQAMYQAAQRLAKTDEYKGVFKDFDINPVGVNDQQTLGQAVSPVEGILGNTTIGQLMRLRSDYKPEIPQEIPVKEIPKENPELLYYCVKGADGKGNIVSVKKGEAAPAGATTAYATADEAERACIGTPPDLVDKPKYRPVSGQMWGPDKFAILSAMSQKPAQDYSKYITRRNVVAPNFAYALESPDTFIQAANSQTNNLLDYLGNTTAANTAVASNFNNLGELAKGIGDVQNRNIGIVNNAAYQNAAMNFDADKYNKTNLSQNDQLMAAYKRDYDNADRQYKGAVNKAIIKGWGNMIDTNLLEQSASDQYSSDRNIGKLDMIPGTGLDVTNPYYGASTNMGYSDFMDSYSDDLTKKAQEVYNSTLKSTGNEELAKLAAQNVYKMADANTRTAQNPRMSRRPYGNSSNRPTFG